MVLGGIEMKVLNQVVNDKFALYHGDCVDVTKGIPDNSIHEI